MLSTNNKVQLAGRLGADPEIRSLENGRKMAKFRIATNEYYKNAAGEKITDTHWHQLVAFGKLAETAEKDMKKGVEVAIEGKLSNRSYVDKSGNKKYATEVEVGAILRIGPENKE